MISETIHELPPLYHDTPGAQSAQSAMPSEKPPLLPQPDTTEGPQVDPNVPRDTRDVATIAQSYRDNCKFHFVLCQQLF
jgi:hypothetical protein